MNRAPIGVVRFALCLLLAAPSSALAQTELAVLRAGAGQPGAGSAGDVRREPTAADLATIRSASRSRDQETARVAVRALGRFERPALIPDITGLLRHANPLIRAEAANAIGEAAQGWRRHRPARSALDNALAVLVERLNIDDDDDVRATIAETIGRLPYADRDEVEKAARALVEFDARADSFHGAGDAGVTMSDRLGIAKGFEALFRINRSLLEPPEARASRERGGSRDSGGVRGPGESHERCDPCDPADSFELLRRYVTLGAGSTNGARVRRLALQALLTAGAADEALASKAASDADGQVRRLALPAAPVSVLVGSVGDVSPSVRMQALVQLKTKGAPDTCALSLGAVSDPDTQVALVALDQLSGCAASEDAVAALERAVKDPGESRGTRGGQAAWHRAAHALVALAAASPGRASDVLEQFTSSRTWQLRMYGARAARLLANREALEKLAADEDDNVREVAIDALRELFAHATDPIFVAALARPGHQVIRAAAIALAGTPTPEAAIPALTDALDRLNADGRDNSHDARVAIEKALTDLGAARKTSTPARNRAKSADRSASDLNADDLRRLASARARVTIRGVGAFDLLLLTAHAQATVCRFARLAESGYYNGLTFHRVVPNFVIQGGSPGANEYIGDSPFMQDELARWPHVRGAVGISTRGRDTGDAQFFVDLVDNPRLDHEYTVFAQVLNGLDVVDQILEGDVIERIDIIPGP